MQTQERLHARNRINGWFVDYVAQINANSYHVFIVDEDALASRVDAQQAVDLSTV
jgi:hypothetical protein